MDVHPIKINICRTVQLHWHGFLHNLILICALQPRIERALNVAHISLHRLYVWCLYMLNVFEIKNGVKAVNKIQDRH